MRTVSGYARHRGVATLATLQPGIEPAALALLAANHACAPQDFGWIVGAGQAGMAIGAALCWRFDRLAGRQAALSAAGIAAVGNVALAFSREAAAALVVRFVLGLAMGVLLTRATAKAARYRPHHAIGTMLLAQQGLSTAVMAALPIAALAWGATAALASLAIAPLAIILLIGSDDAPVLAPEADAARHGPMTTRLGARRAMAMIFAVTMLAWSYMEVIGEEMGLARHTIGLTIALASLGSVPAALLASLRPPRAAPALTVLIAGSGIVAPLLLPDESGIWAYGAAMTLFNAGSTFAMIRCLAWAMEGREADADRRGVLTIQCVFMAAGPAAGALAMSAGGLAAVGLAAAIGVAAAILAFLSDLPDRFAAMLRETRRAAQLESERLWGRSLAFPPQS